MNDAPRCIFPGCERGATYRMVSLIGQPLLLTDSKGKPVPAYHCDEHAATVMERLREAGLNTYNRYERL